VIKYTRIKSRPNSARDLGSFATRDVETKIDKVMKRRYMRLDLYFHTVKCEWPDLTFTVLFSQFLDEKYFIILCSRIKDESEKTILHIWQINMFFCNFYYIYIYIYIKSMTVILRLKNILFECTVKCF